MSQYDGTIDEVIRQLDWLVWTNDKSVVPDIKRLLAGMKIKLNQDHDERMKILGDVYFPTDRALASIGDIPNEVAIDEETAPIKTARPHGKK